MIYHHVRAISSVGSEHLVYTQGVGGSNPSLIVELCGDNQQKWSEVLETAKASLEVRISLWNYIADSISNHKLEK